MDNFLETYSQPKLNQEEIGNLNKLISRSEIESVINFLQTKVQGQMASQTILPNIQGRIILILLKLFQNIEEEETLPKILQKKKITGQYH